MHNDPPARALRRDRVSTPGRTGARRQRPALRWVGLAASLACAGAAQAIEFGPFTLTGFALADVQRVSSYCEDCGVNTYEDKQRAWADALVYGREYGSGLSTNTIFQPYLVAKFDLPQGFKLEGLLSQRWRDGKVDIPGFVYERNVALSHEDYGSLRIGAMTTRAWSMASSNNVSVSDVWASSGAGYGLLTGAVRYTSRQLDLFAGDMVLEATYDDGKSGWERNKPRFVELWAGYWKGDLAVSFFYQDSRNGTPSAWSHGPFSGPTPFPEDDDKVGSSGQSMAMVTASYKIDASWEVSGGLRANRWSGAYAVITKPKGPLDKFDLWNNMFNVDWGCKTAVPSRCDVDNPGYAARSVDGLLGVQYRTGKWTATASGIFLGEADTDNPSDRGQNNSALVNILGLKYDVGQGLELNGWVGMVNYKRKGLSPMSMPGNAAFTNVDSRIAKHGNWIGASVVYVF